LRKRVPLIAQSVEICGGLCKELIRLLTVVTTNPTSQRCDWLRARCVFSRHVRSR
jgi:hypothetical protein